MGVAVGAGSRPDHTRWRVVYVVMRFFSFFFLKMHPTQRIAAIATKHMLSAENGLKFSQVFGATRFGAQNNTGTQTNTPTRRHLTRTMQTHRHRHRHWPLLGRCVRALGGGQQNQRDDHPLSNPPYMPSLWWRLRDQLTPPRPAETNARRDAAELELFFERSIVVQGLVQRAGSGTASL